MNLIDVFEEFPTHEDCIAHLELVRWGDNPACPYCKSINVTPMPKEKRHHCNNCNTSFSVTVGTIFHNTKISLQKWFFALSIILNAKKGLSARQLGRDLKVNKDTAWRMAMKIRQAMTQHEQRDLLSGIVEADETYVGGKPRKGNRGNRGPQVGGGSGLKRGRGTKKTPVVGVASRDGNVKAESFANRRLTHKNYKALIRKNVDVEGAVLITDQFRGYIGIGKIMPHKTIDHTVWYVDGDIHTNTIESFWALLKRGIIGQYHKVSLRYLPKYIDEFCYRWNNREDEYLFASTLKRAVR